MIRASLAAAMLFLAGGMLPFAGVIGMIFAPIPIVVYATSRPDWFWRSTAAVALAAALSSILAGPLVGAGYFITFGLASIIICGMLTAQRPFEMIVLVATVVLLTAGLLTAWAAAGSLAALSLDLHKSLAAGLARGHAMYKAAGLDFELSPDTRSMLLDVGVRLSPALAALSAASVILMNLAVYWRWWGKSALGYSLFGDLARWATPEWLIWVLLATGFAIFVPFVPIQNLALDGFICVMSVYFCQGLAIMAFYFKMFSMPRIFRALIYVIAGIQPVLAALVCAAGIFDLWVDFRRLKPPHREAGNFNGFL